MEILQAEFVKSASDPSQCPKPVFPEFAFIGRSNVGKSSLINMLTGKKGLAQTSSQPGKTKLINHFIINNSWFLVDLPGYGYARVAKDTRASWSKMINRYFRERENLFCVFLLVDSRIPPQQNDIDMINWLGENSVPFVIVYTKMDKVKKTEFEKSLSAMKKTLSESWETLPEFFYSSAENKSGKSEILEFIEKIVSQNADTTD